MTTTTTTPKTTSPAEIASIKAEYQALRQEPTKALRLKLQAQSRVACLSDDCKAGLITSILINRHGARRVQAALA